MTVQTNSSVGDELFGLDVPGLARHAIRDKESGVASGKKTEDISVEG